MNTNNMLHISKYTKRLTANKQLRQSEIAGSYTPASQQIT